jgi:hypothetical protein
MFAESYRKRFVVHIFFAALIAIGTFDCGKSSNACAGKPSPMLSSISVPQSLAAGGTGQGSVVLTVAPCGSAATVGLSSSNPAAVSVPASVSVSADVTNANFTVTAGAVTSQTTATITGTLGASMTGNVTVTPVLAAIFTVNSTARGADACMVQADTTMECVFNGTGSANTGATSWAWSYTVAGTTIQIAASSTQTVTNPGTNGCALFTGVTDKTVSFVNMPVTLTVTRTGGTASATNNNVRVFPRNGTCGF